MKIIVTGAAGYLGSHLVRLLQDTDFEVAGIDRFTPRDTQGVPFVEADLANPESEKAICELFSGADCIVHCASIHPWKEYSDDEYLDANIKGTWRLYSLAERAGVKKVVLTSSIAAVGYNIPRADWPVQESRQYALTDLYSLTKHTQEDIARHYAAKDIQTLALRPPAFMPKPELETGFLLTGNFSVVSDIAAAHLAAVEVLCNRRQSQVELENFEAIYITNALPYQPEDTVLLESGSTKDLVRKHWPHAYEWLLARDYENVWLLAAYDLSKAQSVLGWQPVYNFEQWFEEHGSSGNAS